MYDLHSGKDYPNVQIYTVYSFVFLLLLYLYWFKIIQIAEFYFYFPLFLLILMNLRQSEIININETQNLAN